ncbi:MAG: hypothetical protein RL722_964 [Pseudomonadota bacterium]|jgi:hypothetical protein
MAFTPDQPFPKTAGATIRSKDWNDLVTETQRLDTAKVNRSGDTISGPLSINAALAIGKASASAGTRLDVNGGDLRINDANIQLRGGTDNNHGLGWYGGTKAFGGVTPDGPVLYGFTGGALGTTNGGNKAALIWNSSGQITAGSTDAKVTLRVEGTGHITNGGGYAVPSGRMAAGSLTVGSITTSFGGGSGWNANTAGLLLETLADTEIAVHDSGDRITSLAHYQGGAANRITIGRDMGWGAPAQVAINTDLNLAGLCLSNKFDTTTLYSGQPGPLTLSKTFTSHGGCLVVFASGSGWRSAGGVIGMSVRVDNAEIAVAKCHTNEGNSHKAFASCIGIPLAANSAAGTHTLTLVALANTLTDVNDYYNVTIIELPFPPPNPFVVFPFPIGNVGGISIT